MTCQLWLKEAYIKAVERRCEICGKSEPEVNLEIHRIIRGNKGGKYIPRNCQVVCEDCHKLIHGKEFLCK